MAVDSAISDASPLSVTDEGNSTQSAVLSDVSYSLIGIYMFFACGVSVVGNGLLGIKLAATGAWRRPAVNYYITSITVASFIESVAGFPLIIVSNFKGKWIFSETGCHLYAFIVYTCVLHTMMCYFFVTIHRYRVVVRRVPADSRDTRRWVLLTLMGTWIYALCWSVCPYLGWGTYGLEPFKTSCSLDWTSKVATAKIYNIMVFLFLLFVPVITMMTCSIKVMMTLNMQVGNGMNIVNATAETTTTTITTSTREGSVIHARSLKIILLTLTTFVLCWSPYGLMSMLANFDVPIHAGLSALPTMMAKSHCAIFPVVYFICFRHYRAPITEVFGLE